MRHFFLGVASLLVAAGAAAGAEITVSGKVIDETGAAVAGARVELQASDAEPAVVIFSDTAGNLLFVLPHPGEYRIYAVRQGFFVLREPARVFTDGENVLTITLTHQRELAESIDVTYSPPEIDLQQPAEHRELDNTEILSVPYPAPQDFRNSLPLLNGVVQDTGGRLHVNGGGTEQTDFSFDGFHISDPVTGRLDARLNIESVRTIEMESSRISAEQGRGSAGVVTVKTKMGDDRLRFGGTNFIPGISTEQGLHVNKWTPRLELSGPIVKSRAWFYNGFDLFYDQDTVRELPRGQNRTTGMTGSNLSRFQVDLTPANILIGSFLVNRSDRSRLGLDFLNPAETTRTTRSGLYFSTLRDQMYFSRGALVEVGFADTRGTVLDRPQGTELYEITPFGSRGNYFINTDRHFYRQQWLANAFLPAITAAGSHQIKFGLDFERESFHQEILRHDYEVLRVDNSVARHVTFQGSPLQARKNFEAAQFVQDRWTPREGLLFEAGLRAEWNEIVRTIVWAPRLSAVWAPRRLSNTKFSVGYGVYYDSINLGIVTRQQDQISLATFYSPRGVVSGPVRTQFEVNEQALRVPRFQNFSLTVERKLPFEFYGRAAYLHRRGTSGFTFLPPVADPTSLFEEGAVYQLSNTRRDRYDAFEISLRRTFAKRFEWFGGFTRSSTRTSAVVDYSLENPIFAPQMPGPLPWDTPNRFLTWGWAPVPKRILPSWLQFAIRETDVQYLFESRTGFPFQVVNEEGFLVGKANSHRYPRYFNLNLHFERRFQALRYLWAWRFGFNNITGSLNANSVNNNIDSPLFLTYGRGQSRAFSVRLRFLGKK